MEGFSLLEEDERNIRKIIRFKHFEVLESILTNPKNKFKIARKVKMTYSHIVKSLKHYERIGLVHIFKKGKEDKITLTSKGFEVFKILELIFRRFEYGK